MSQDDVLFGYRLQLVALAGRIGVTAACRAFARTPMSKLGQPPKRWWMRE